MIYQELDCDYLQIVDFFKGTELFRPLCPNSIIKLVKQMDKISLQKGETLIENKAILDGICIVFRGELEVTYNDGRSSFIKKKSMIGRNALLNPIIFPGTIKAKKNSQILIFRKKDMSATISQNLKSSILNLNC